MGQNMSDCTGCRNENDSTFFGCKTKPLDIDTISTNIFNNGDHFIKNKSRRRRRKRYKKNDL